MLVNSPPAPPPPISASCAHAASSAGARCGFVRVPIDHANPSGTKIRVYYEFYPATDTGPVASTVLSIEGGPGYSTTADRSGRIALWKPLSAHRNLLLVDLRGTGRSGALACKAFADHILGYIDRAGRCARQLGPRIRYYDTSQSVQDLESVLESLKLGKIDLYGDSYGSYAAQAFALRFPWRLRSLTLDSTYQLPGSDPAFADLAGASRDALVLSCERTPTCQAHHDPLGVIAALVQRVRQHPITGTAPDGDGHLTHVVVTEDTVVQAVQFGFAWLGVYRDLIPAALAAQQGDTQPLLRLIAETEAVDGGAGAPRSFSEGLYDAVICHDYPQLWPASTPISQRPGVAAQELAHYPQSAFYPFSTAAWTGTDYEGALACLKWPDSPSASDPPVPPGTPYPHVPTLVMAGDMDNITPLSDNKVVASRFPDSALVVVHNNNHVQAEYDDNSCGSVIYENFVRNLTPGDTSCAAHVAPVRVVPRYPLALHQVTPVLASTGNKAPLVARRLAAAAAATVADAIDQWWVNYSGTDRGLRGGRWSYHSFPTTVFTFKSTQFVPGVAVSGTAKWNYDTGPVVVHVTVRGGGTSGNLAMHWSMQGPASQAVITGRVGGAALRAHMLAP